MAIAAVPKYLGQDFRDAAPGHTFYLYFPIWEPDARKPWSIDTSAKTKAARQAGKLSDDDRRRMHALAERQAALAQSLLGQSRRGLWQLPARSTAPFATGLGMEHPLENGFAFLSPYGLPYLPGSGIKGVVRQAARELAEGEFGEPNAGGWSKPTIDALFGKPADNGEDTRRGALAFWDAYPVLADKQTLQVEIMTPHQTHYYIGGQSPHDSGSPNPIPFLAIPPGTRFCFYVECNRPLLERLDASLAAAERWQALLDAAFRHAFDWLGFGAKTAVGYGAMAVDETVRAKAEQEAAEKRQAAARKAELEGITDLCLRRIEELLDQRDDRNQPDYVFLIQQLEAGAFEGEDKRRAAEDIRARMEKQGKWNPDGKGSKTAQKKAHKHTLTVLGYLGE